MQPYRTIRFGVGLCVLAGALLSLSLPAGAKTKFDQHAVSQPKSFQGIWIPKSLRPAFVQARERVGNFKAVSLTPRQHEQLARMFLKTVQAQKTDDFRQAVTNKAPGFARHITDMVRNPETNVPFLQAVARVGIAKLRKLRRLKPEEAEWGADLKLHGVGGFEATVRAPSKLAVGSEVSVSLSDPRYSHLKNDTTFVVGKKGLTLQENKRIRGGDNAYGSNVKWSAFPSALRGQSPPEPLSSAHHARIDREIEENTGKERPSSASNSGTSKGNYPTQSSERYIPPLGVTIQGYVPGVSNGRAHISDHDPSMYSLRRFDNGRETIWKLVPRPLD